MAFHTLAGFCFLDQRVRAVRSVTIFPREDVGQESQVQRQSRDVLRVFFFFDKRSHCVLNTLFGNTVTGSDCAAAVVTGDDFSLLLMVHQLTSGGPSAASSLAAFLLPSGECFPLSLSPRLCSFSSLSFASPATLPPPPPPPPAPPHPPVQLMLEAVLHPTLPSPLLVQLQRTMSLDSPLLPYHEMCDVPQACCNAAPCLCL